MCAFQRRQIPFADVQFRQVKTSRKHSSHISYIGSIKSADIKFCQFPATAKHSCHISYLGSIKSADIKFCQAHAVTEHITHICDIRSVKVADIQTHCGTALKHPTHICDIRCIDFRHINTFNRSTGEKAVGIIREYYPVIKVEVTTIPINVICYFYSRVVSTIDFCAPGYCKTIKRGARIIRPSMHNAGKDYSVPFNMIVKILQPVRCVRVVRISGFGRISGLAGIAGFT